MDIVEDIKDIEVKEDITDNEKLRIFRKKNKANYDVKYIVNRTKNDEEFRNKRREYYRNKYHEHKEERQPKATAYYLRKKQEKYIEEHGSLEGFKYNPHK